MCSRASHVLALSKAKIYIFSSLQNIERGCFLLVYTEKKNISVDFTVK